MWTKQRRLLSTSWGHSLSTLLSASVAARWRKWRTSSSSECRSCRTYAGTKTPLGSRKGPSRNGISWGSWNKPLSPSASSGPSTVVWWSVFWCISTWYSSCSRSDKKALERTVRGAERVRVSLPSVQELLQSSCRSRALNINRDTSHPLHTFFELLRSGKWIHKGWTNRLINSFLPQAVKLMNCSSGACALLCLWSSIIVSSVIDPGET